MAVVSVSERVVVEYTQGSKPSRFWIPTKVKHIGNEAFVTVGYSGDRGFARFCGGDVTSSNPLRSFTWLTSATKLRNKLVDAAIDNVARAKVLGHIAGAKIPSRIRSVIAADIPATQTVEFPPLRVDDKDVPGVAMTVALDIDGHAPFCFAISTDVARYIQIAMAQSKTDKVERKHIG